MQLAPKRGTVSNLWFAVALVLGQAALFFFYRDFRSFDLDQDGMRAILNRLWWHKSESITDPWYNYRYWLSESLLDLLIYGAYKVHAQLDGIRTLVFAVANLCSLACALILLKACGKKLSGLFMLLTWTIPVPWALSSYMQGMTTVNFWLASLSAALLGAFLLTKQKNYLRVLAATVALDLLHLYPSAVLINASIVMVITLKTLMLPRQERRPGWMLVGQAAAIGGVTYLLGALVFGFMMSADWLGYFKVLPFFVRFYFTTRATETKMDFPPGHILDELRWLLFGGAHVLPANEECEQPMYVPELALLPGLLMILGMGLWAWRWWRMKRMPAQTLMLIPLGVFLLALRQTATAQRHYMALIFMMLVFLAATFAEALGSAKDKKRAVALGAVLLLLGLPVLWQQRAVSAAPFGVMGQDVVWGRQAGFARMMGDLQTYLDSWEGPVILLIANNFRGPPQVLASEFIVGLMPQERLKQSVVLAEGDWQVEPIVQSGAPKIIAFVHWDDAAKRRDLFLQAGYTIDHELTQFQKVAIFARRN